MNRNAPGERGIIRPVIRKGDPHISPDTLMMMIPSDLSYLVQASEAAEVPFSEKDLYGLYKTPGDGEHFLSIAGPFLGAPHAVMGMEKLIALGARRLWVMGWCGSLQPDLPIGGIVIPDSALSEEGTSMHYPVDQAPIRSDSRLNRELEFALDQQRISFRKGVVWTTDAPYRETANKVLSHGQEGVLAVEMEMSALMTVALYRSVSMAGLLVVSDELSDLNWRTGFRDPRLRKSVRIAADTLLKVAFSMERKEPKRNEHP